MIGLLECLVARVAVFFPLLLRRGVAGRNFPTRQRAVVALRQSLLLLVPADVEIIFADLHAVLHQHVLERHDGFVERLELLLGAEAHHLLDGRNGTKRWKYHCVSSLSDGLPGAWMRVSRGLM